MRYATLCRFWDISFLFMHAILDFDLPELRKSVPAGGMERSPLHEYLSDEKSHD